MSFEKAAASIKESSSSGPQMNDDERLHIYGLYKQGTVGDINIDKPGLTDLKGKAKWEAWHKEKGKPKETAQHEYIEYARSLFTKYGIPINF
jgi:diazepam-binding inhibitor (GABA receptor modulating acyl-CoA-binding protein)